MSNSKTHWLQSPNKNYLGHWDLPNGKDLVLTIASAQWEKVKNPITNKSEAKRVIRFKEQGVKPMICNQTNAQAIIKSTGVKFMEDSEGTQIQLYVGVHTDKRTKEDVDCIRVRKEITLTENQVLNTVRNMYEELKDKLSEKEKTNIERVINNEESNSYQKVIDYLTQKANG